MFQPHWGDLPLIPDTESGIAAIEREQITKPRPVEVEGAKLYQPLPVKQSQPKELSQEYSTVDALTLHTIKLIHHAKKIRSLLHSVQPQVENAKGDAEGLSNLPPVPQMPELTECVAKYRCPGDITGKTWKSDFVLGRGKPPPELTFNIVRQLLKKAIGAICAHIGFDNATETVLDTLVDTVHEHNLRICHLLRIAVDREALTGNTGFVDVIEQVFHEIGLGSVTVLHNFYQNRIVGYHNHMMKTCQQLTLEYEKLKAPDLKLPDDSKIIRIKEEPVSEIQFPVMEEQEEAHQEASQIPLQLEELQGVLQNIEPDSTSTLKDEESMKWPPGQGIKKENNIQIITPNLDPDEEIINVSDSSPPPTPGDIDISQGIPSVAISDTLSPGMDSTRIGKPPKKKKKK